MIKAVLPAVAVLALAAPFAAQAQMVQPMVQPSPYATNASVVTTGPMQPGPGETITTTSITGEPRPGYVYPGTPGYGMAPAPGYVEEQMQPMQPTSPRTTWIPGHYNWDPNTSNYAWTPGQFIEAPTTTAQWIPGHWEQTPTAWIWINGGWR